MSRFNTTGDSYANFPAIESVPDFNPYSFTVEFDYKATQDFSADHGLFYFGEADRGNNLAWCCILGSNNGVNGNARELYFGITVENGTVLYRRSDSDAGDGTGLWPDDGQYHRLTVEADPVTKLWNLYIDSELVPLRANIPYDPRFFQDGYDRLSVGYTYMRKLGSSVTTWTYAALRGQIDNWAVTNGPKYGGLDFELPDPVVTSVEFYVYTDEGWYQLLPDTSKQEQLPDGVAGQQLIVAEGETDVYVFNQRDSKVFVQDTQPVDADIVGGLRYGDMWVKEYTAVDG